MDPGRAALLAELEAYVADLLDEFTPGACPVPLQLLAAACQTLQDGLGPVTEADAAQVRTAVWSPLPPWLRARLGGPR